MFHVKHSTQHINEGLAPLVTCLQNTDNKTPSVRATGFHPSLIPFLIDQTSLNFIFYFTEEELFSAFQQIEFIMDGVGLYIPAGNEGGVLCGFETGNNKVGVGAVSSLIAAKQPFKFVLTYNGIINECFATDKSTGSSFLINGSVQYDELITWLNGCGYSFVDTVVESGTCSVRGNIIDIYSYSMLCPVRINFFDNPVLIHRFNKDTQLTFLKITSCILYTILSSQSKKFPFKKIVENLYVDVFVEGGVACFGKNRSENNIKLPFKFLQYDECAGFEKNGLVIKPTNKLYNMGIISGEEMYVPETYLKKQNYQQSVLQKGLLFGDDFNSINIGDYLVHRNYGVGRFLGLRLSTSKNSKRESLIIEYRDGEFVSVSTENMHLVSYYSPGFEEGIKLNSLSKLAGWKKKISSVKKEINIIVDSIIVSMSERGSITREPYSIDNNILNRFINQFKYTDTPDQSASWREIYNDLLLNKPMDRVVCGDVGFGKTELAERAALVVSFSGKQVVVLAPTTILALQLYNSFIYRFSGYPQNIALLSRLQSNSEKIIVKEGICNGSIDIIIGTHALLSKDISFKRIGLVVVDEEHRFGVKQKEVIKSISKDIDILSLSATPIPRTLQLTVSGIRNISTLFTPPDKRLSVITSVNYSNMNIISMGVRFELHRNGQVFIVYNNVKNIDIYTDKIRAQFPEACVDYIHGQESSVNIERKLSAFLSKNINVLVCSSIIEAGIDIPGANTIFIENSHKFGLAQLYQLKGRVGRSNVQAYAYLLVPENYRLGQMARKRLKTIQQNTALGSGYYIASQDLTNRGSGSLFGYKQSGNYDYIGKELYTTLVDEVCNKSIKISSNCLIPISNVFVDIFVDSFIPDEYIHNQALRFDLYKKIFAATDLDYLNQLKFSVVDRFGQINPPVSALFSTQSVRIIAAMVGISRIINNRGCLKIYFSDICNDIIEISANFFNPIKIEYHFQPINSKELVLLVELTNSHDTFEIVTSFLNILRDGF